MTRPERLLAWYDKERRDLPWRREPFQSDPWAVWVSEVMLQQTRVETAIPYFLKFLERFPEPGALAAAPVEEALAAWSGLGYYRRVRLLREAAIALGAAGGAIPRRAEDLVRLPGVGAYTAAAIASIAFGERVAVLDGNVERVVARLTAETEAPRRAASRRRLLAGAAALLSPERPGDSNQALMELGATVCLPQRPRCESCPLAGSCRALAAGAVERYPVRETAPAIARIAQTAALAERDGLWLLFRRGEGEARLAGLWEFPLVGASRRDRAERALAERYGGSWTLGEPVARLRHAITTALYSIAARRAEFTEPRDELRENGAGAEGGWYSAEDAEALALTGATRKIFERIRR